MYSAVHRTFASSSDSVCQDKCHADSGTASGHAVAEGAIADDTSTSSFVAAVAEA